MTRARALGAVICLSVVAVWATGLRAQAMLTIYLNPKYIGTGDTRVIEVRDVNCNVTRGSFSITGGGQRVAVSVCQSAAGYGRINYRNVTNNGDWVQSSLLSNGDEVSP